MDMQGALGAKQKVTIHLRTVIQQSLMRLIKPSLVSIMFKMLIKFLLLDIARPRRELMFLQYIRMDKLGLNLSK
jgi:hypothetical protein